MSLTDYRDHTGEIRKLARLQPSADQMRMRAGRTNIQTYRTQNGLSPLILPGDPGYGPNDRSGQLGIKFVLNQGQFGACVGFSNAAAEMKTRFFASADFQIFSGAFTYALIDGGSDNGAVITDAMAASMSTGNVLQSQFDLPNLVFSGSPQPLPPALLSSAAQFKSTDCLTVGSWAEVVTAILMGFVVQAPVQVGSNFENFDANGVCGYNSGPGNHSIHLDSLILLSTGELIGEGDNTWGMWGYKQNGRLRLRQKHIDGCAVQDDAFAHISSRLPEPPAPVV